jgi:pimeloyl-ACP methyl ester carboxylesterase
MLRTGGSLLLTVAGAYAAVVALVFLFQTRLVYYPEIGRELVHTPRAYNLAFEDVTLRTSDGESLHAWWVPAENARGVVLFFHGNAGNISHRLDYLLMFHRLRHSTLIVDYRGYGRSTGRPSEAGTYRDAEAAWEHLRQARGVRAADLVVAGESLGGGVATWLAARVQPRAVLLFSTFTSATDLGAEIYWFLPVRWISRIGYDNMANLRNIRAPVLVAHSPQDEIVPYAHGRRLYESIGGPRAFLELRGGHNEGFVFARPEWVAQLAAFLDGLDGGGPPLPQRANGAGSS